MRPHVLAFLAVASVAPVAAQTGPPRLEIESRFWPNLHQFLYLVSQSELGLVPADRTTVRAVREDAPRAVDLTDEERVGWERAVTHYKESVARLSIWEDLARVNSLLALTPDTATPQLPDADLGDALAAAAPAYRRLWWPRHEASNRRWIAEQQVHRRRRGDAVASRLSRMLRADWPGTPIPVEVVAHATMFGAYQQDAPPMLHLSSLYSGHAGTLGFEQLYHEAGHVIDDGVFDALRAEAQRQAKTAGLQRWVDLAHAILFYTAGDSVRRAIPEHVPYAEAEGVWRRAPRNRQLLVAHWLPYLEGEIGFEDAIRRLVAATE